MLISAARYRSRRNSAASDDGVAFTVSGSPSCILRALRLLEVHTDGQVDLWIPPSAEALIPVLERHPRVRQVFVSPAAAHGRNTVRGPIPVYGRYRAVIHLECDGLASLSIDAEEASRKLKWYGNNFPAAD